jgi:hypothetical protein
LLSHLPEADQLRLCRVGRSYDGDAGQTAAADFGGEGVRIVSDRPRLVGLAVHLNPVIRELGQDAGQRVPPR